MKKIGSIEVVCGPMFAGKTEELIRRIKRLQYAKKNVLVFSPSIDNRYATDAIVSHDMQKVKAYQISNPIDILKYIKNDIDAVVIDETQFFDNKIIDIADYLADQGIRVIIGGLDLDFRGEPFGPMPYLLAKAEQVTKLTAICPISGEPATRTQRIINGSPANYNDSTVLIGAKESYEPRTRSLHEVPGKKSIKDIK